MAAEILFSFIKCTIGQEKWDWSPTDEASARRQPELLNPPCPATRVLSPPSQSKGRRLLLGRARARYFFCSTGSAWTKAFNLSDIYHNCRVICYPAILLLLQTEILSWSRDPVWQNRYVFLKSICLYAQSIFQGKKKCAAKKVLARAMSFNQVNQISF